MYQTKMFLMLGCVALVANSDWSIFVRNDTGSSTGDYVQMLGTVNVNESACSQHPTNSGDSTLYLFSWIDEASSSLRSLLLACPPKRQRETEKEIEGERERVCV